MKNFLQIIAIFILVTNLLSEENVKYPPEIDVQQLSPHYDNVDLSNNTTRNINWEYIDEFALRTRLYRNSSNSLIYLWYSSNCHSNFNSELLDSLKNIQNLNIYIILLDYGTKSQTENIEKLLAHLNYNEKFYIYDYKFNEFNDLIMEMMDNKQKEMFVKNLGFSQYNFTKPGYVILKNNKLASIFNKPINYAEFSEILNNDNVLEETIYLKDIVKDTNSTKDSIICQKLLNMSKLLFNIKNIERSASENKVKEIQINSMDSLFSNSENYKLVHLWGSWCPHTSFGIKDFPKEIIDDTTLKKYFISFDYNSEEQKAVLGKIFESLNYKIPQYIVNYNHINNTDDWIKDIENNYSLNLYLDYFQIHTVDHPVLPVTILFDKQNKIIYYHNGESVNNYKKIKRLIMQK